MGNTNSKPGKFDTQQQLTRLHWLVQRIQKGDYPSQKVLSEEWEISWRTIQSDLNFIRNVWDLPLEYDQHRYGYYFSEPVANFPMIPISERELVSVFVAQKAMRPYHGTPFEDPLRSAFEKLVSSLHGEISVKWEDLDAAISFRGIETAADDMEVLAELSAAVRSRREVEFDYYKLEGGDGGEIRRPKSEGREKSEFRNPKEADSPSPWPSPQGEGASLSLGGEVRRVRPYHLGCIGGQWYLFAYDLMRKDIRKFVPGRMRNLRVRETRFERPANFSVDKYLKGSFGVFSGGELRRVRIRFDAFAGRLVKEKRWHHSQEVREFRNGEIEVTFELSSFVEIVPWILGWGRHARAVVPRALVQEVAAEVKAVGNMY
jgi:proteasome accessory factor B